MKLETFIFVHDQKIILDFIRSEKFSEIENLKYVFLGSGDTSKIKNNTDVIICRDLEYNIEQYPKLTSFSGWYALWKNNLFNGEYLNLFEYDVNLSDDFELKLTKLIDGSEKFIGYIPFNVHHYNYIKHSPWSHELLNSIKNNYNINVTDVIDSFPPNKECSMTSNHTISKIYFCDYMEWMEKMIDEIKLSFYSGHQVERSISLFYLLNNLNYEIIPNVLTHFQFDSHKTQGISQDKFKKEYTKLLQ